MKRKLNLALWIVAGILAVVFLVASSTKLFVPKEKLAGMGGAASRWVEDFSPGALKAIGALEFLAAVGLIVPAALGIAPVLVPLAATGAVLLFAGAVIMRLRRGERATIIGDLVYLAMAAFVAWGRFGPGSFTRQTQRGALSRARRRRLAPGGLLDRGRTRSLTRLRGADPTVGSGRFARRRPYQRRAPRTVIGWQRARSRHSGSPAVRELRVKLRQLFPAG